MGNIYQPKELFAWQVFEDYLWSRYYLQEQHTKCDMILLKSIK